MKSQVSRSEVLRLAHQIRKQNRFLSWSQCQRTAWQVARLKAALHGGAVRFRFQKTDGEIREAYGTTADGLFEYERKGTGGTPSPCQIKYFDLDKGAWRSFRAERFLGLAA